MAMLEKYKDFYWDDGAYMITTYDNPFNPFEDFINWFKFDMINKHNTCGLFDRLACCDNQLFNDEKNDELRVEAAKEMISRWPFIFRPVRKEDYQ